MITVLYICADIELRGSTRSLSDLIDSVRDEVTPVVLLKEYGIAYDHFTKKGIECIVCRYQMMLLSAHPWRDFIRRPWGWYPINYFRTDWRCKRYLKKYFKGRKIDLVHTNTSPMTIGKQLAKLFNVPHVWHVREGLDTGVHIPGGIYGGFQRLRKIIDHADARIVISPQMQMRWQFREDNTWIIPDAIGKAADKCIEKDKSPYILFCSWFITKEKGIYTVLEAYSKSGLSNDGISLMILGKCNDGRKKELVSIAKKYGVNPEKLIFLPPQLNIRPYFAKAKAFVTASLNEGLGRVTAEAMLYGCPVIALASGGTIDLVNDRENGYLFTSTDECAKLMREVCLSPQESIVQQAQADVISSLTQEVYGPKILNVYKEVLKTRGINDR